MKNTVDAIIKNFTKEEYREFKYLVSKNTLHKNSRVDISIINHIRNGTDSPKNMTVGNYRQTKSRIKQFLEQFIIKESARTKKLSQIITKMEVGIYLIEKGLSEHGWDYMKKAENLALESEEFELLNFIYHLQIANTYNIANMPPSKLVNVMELISNWKKNLTLASINSNTNAAYAELIYRLREEFSQQLDINVDTLVNGIMVKYDLQNELNNDKMNIYLKTVNMVCRVLREKREYHPLKIYSINAFQHIRHLKMLGKVPILQLMDLLDVICIAALRSKDYFNYERFQRLYSAYAKKQKQHQDEFSYYDFIPAIDAGDLYMVTNRLEMAKSRLEPLYNKYKKHKENARIFFLLRANLIALNFKDNNYEKCINLYTEIVQYSEKKILAEPGLRLELMIFTDIYACMFYYEIKDYEQTLYLLNKIKRKYVAVFNKSESSRELEFVKIIERMANTPKLTKSNQFKSLINKFVEQKEYTPGDNEYISFNAWLLSKLNNTTYYQAFINIVS